MIKEKPNHCRYTSGIASALPPCAESDFARNDDLQQTFKALVDRADAEMYRNKAASRKSKIKRVDRTAAA
jgi:hypothetical protein